MSKKRTNSAIAPPVDSEVIIVKSGKGNENRARILIVTPTLGNIRIEWALSRWGQVIPCNWSAGYATLGIGFHVPMHYLIADAQNIGCEEMVKKGYEWMLLWEDDTIAPPDAFLRLHKYMLDLEEGKPHAIPIVSGLYFTKGLYSEPILYRGHGNGCFRKFKIGQRVWADGVPTGFLLIHKSIIKLMYDESPEYKTLGNRVTRRVFETPAKVYWDPETNSHSSGSGTSDLYWCRRVIEEKVLQRAGWEAVGRRKYPFMCDTNIFCKHIDRSTGEQYPKK